MAGSFKTLLIGAAASASAFIAAGNAFAQTTNCQGRPILLLDFRSPALESGSALSPGATYRFSNVATGVDALVSIDALTNSSLATIDNDAVLAANFQPQLAPIGNNNPRSADFTITLVLAGTSIPVAADFASSAIDVDGDSGNLREYAEFSQPIAEFALETPTRLVQNASGPSVPNNERFEASTTFTAPGIDETATQNIVSVFYTSTSSFNYRIGTLGTGGTTRLTSLDFTCPNINFPTGNPQVDQDFGDAPVNPYGNPRHDIVAGIQLGATNTVDTGPFDSPTASGDAGDDGVTLPASFTRGQTETIDVSVTGAGGRLQAWIDFNADGDFTTAGDQIAVDVTDGGFGDADNQVNGNIRLSFRTPVSAVPGQTFARFRWGTQSGIDSTLTASNGEVEDYQATISAAQPPATCPAGEAVVSQAGNATAIEDDISVARQNLALGPLAAAGTTPPDGVSAEMNAVGDLLTLDLGASIPQNAIMTLSLGRDGGAAGNNTQANILFSSDDLSYTSVGIYGPAGFDFPSAAQDVVEHIDVFVPIPGARFVRFDTLNGDDLFIDGVEYTQVCRTSTEVNAVKSVDIYDPTNAGLFAVPGNDVVYTITATNTGASAVDTDTVFIIDRLPAEVEFFNDDFDGTGPVSGPVEFTQSNAGLTFNAATDLAFSNSVAPPATFAECSYSAASGYDSDIRFVCLNPKGSMAAGDPDPSFTVRFRSRIK
ncbi:MAG: GEVED domain-containing protein [Pseudomonadota bacterium]